MRASYTQKNTQVPTASHQSCNETTLTQMTLFKDLPYYQETYTLFLLFSSGREANVQKG